MSDDKKDNAVTGIRKLRKSLEDRSPAFAAIGGISRRADAFCAEVRALIRQHRTAKNITQGQLAEALGIDQSFISRLEGGDGDVGVKTIYRFAEALGYRPLVVFVPSAHSMEQALPARIKPEEANRIEDFQVSLLQALSNVLPEVINRSRAR